MQTLAPLAPPRPEPAAGTTVRDRRPTRWLCWLVPAMVTGVVVAVRAGTPGPWRDELATWSAAHRTVPQIVELGRHIDGVTVPYYLLAHVMAGFGDSILVLRLPSMLAATATAAVTALLARRLWDPRAAFVAGLLVAAMPVVSRYGQEARGYALAALFAVTATLFLLRALGSGRWWDWLAYATSVLFLGWSHQLALLLLLGHAVTVAVIKRRALFAWLAGVAVAATGVLPFTLLGVGQHAAQLDWLSPAEPADLADVAGTIFLSGVIGGAVCALALMALRGRDRRASLLFVSALLPVLTLYAIDQLVTPMFVGRYLVFVVPLLCALAGRALADLRLPLGLTAVLVLAAIGLPLQEDIRRTHSGSDYRQAAAMIHAQSRPGDGIIYAPRAGWHFTDIALRYYLGDDVPKDVLLQSDEVANASLWATECAGPAACLAGTDRVWTLSGDDLETGRRAGSTDQLTPAQQAVLNGSFRQMSQARVDGFTLALFVRRASR
ncbi:glycosyltransferase family 39 protein [Couchioplanes caeruleus]|uniref:glycosyltransferase family 39 protein n=1 Tax=Couchioplanes caeruleus TaxID=56438 RepID=UPI0020BF3B4B|nr:glycosyltransferase family 39 protein [Couchioplanes caeruleus]UQU65951.1 glycosyltransferase family 39 protein [Couchioplanes caeruleus]